MPRPPKWRRVEFEPEFTLFKPAGVPKWQLEELVLSVEEIEAIRLKDLEGLEQEQCAEKMHISRPTFQRILMSARSKLAEAIVRGKAIRIEGGNYRLATTRYCCTSCRKEFETPHGRQGHGHRHGYGHDVIPCPECGSEIERSEDEKDKVEDNEKDNGK